MNSYGNFWTGVVRKCGSVDFRSTRILKNAGIIDGIPGSTMEQVLVPGDHARIGEMRLKKISLRMPKMPKVPNMPKIVERAFSTINLIYSWQ